MNFKWRRRDIFPLAGATAITPLTVNGLAAQPQIDIPTWGIQLNLRWHKGGWYVTIVDWNSIEEKDYWAPGMIPPTKHIPLNEYLADIEQKLKLQPST